MSQEVTYDFRDRVALITGAGGGIGFAAAAAFAKAGAKVVLADINQEILETACRELTAGGYDAVSEVCNVSDEIQVKSLLEKISGSFGTLDFAFNNAGVNSPATDVADLTAEEFDRIIGVDLRGLWLCMKYELQIMRKQGTGAIVNTSSLSGLVGNGERPVYCAAKHGVVGLTKDAAITYAPQGIRINAICPGTIETPMVKHMAETGDLSRNNCAELTPMKRIGTAQEVAGAVLWLCSDAASYVTGHSLAVDGGYTII